MKSLSLFAVISFGCFLLGIIAGTWGLSQMHSTRVDDVIAMAWGDGVYGKAFYGAQVYVVPVGPRFTVRATIHIGHGNNLFKDCGVLGSENTFEDAVQKWGKIDWRPDGLHIGSYFMPQGTIETHR